MTTLRNGMTIAEAQHDVRHAHFGGFVGLLVSGALWLATGAVALAAGPRAAMLTIALGGALIYPCSVLVIRLLGRSGLLAPANPFGALARESAFIIPLCLPLVFAAALAHREWFFPALLVLVGAHYLPFATLYGMRLYHLVAATLIAAGLLLGLAVGTEGAGFASGAFLGGAIEVFFGLLVARHELIGTALLRRAGA